MLWKYPSIHQHAILIENNVIGSQIHSTTNSHFTHTYLSNSIQVVNSHSVATQYIYLTYELSLMHISQGDNNNTEQLPKCPNKNENDHFFLARFSSNDEHSKSSAQNQTRKKITNQSLKKLKTFFFGFESYITKKRKNEKK